MNNIIEIKDLNIGYGKNIVLNNLNFSIEEGDYISIAGPNGAGKSTLIKTLLGLVTPISGQINFINISKNSIGYLPQTASKNHQIFPAKVMEIIEMGLFNSKNGKGDNSKKINDIMEKLNIIHLKDKRIGELSGGQKQRVLLGRALVNNPKLLILDEPTAALDPKIRNEFYEMLDELNKNFNITILFITHDLATVGKYSKKMLYLDKSLVFYGDYEQFCESDMITQYFGYNQQHQICWRHTHDN